MARLSGVKFLYRDFRVGFREGQKKARELGMYMQKYCGCIFSEEERYQKQILRDKLASIDELPKTSENLIGTTKSSNTSKIIV